MIVGVLVFAISSSTVGTVGATVSMVSSFIVASVAVPPMPTTVALTSYIPSVKAAGITSVQVLSVLSVRFPSPSV